MSRFTRPGPAPADPTPAAVDTEGDRRVAIQRLLRHYGPVLDAMLAGRIEQDRAQLLIDGGRARVRQALLDATGAAPDVLVDEIAGRVVGVELDGGSVDIARLTGSVMTVTRTAEAFWETPPDRGFPLTDRASMIATLLDAAARTNAFGDRVGLPPVRCASLFDHVCQRGADLATELLGGADQPRNLYNLTQSCIRHLSQKLDRLEPPAAGMTLATAIEAVDRTRTWLAQSLGAMIDDPGLPQPAAERDGHAPGN